MVSLVLHVLAAIVFWGTWKFVPVVQDEPEVEWTWSAPAPEKPVREGIAPIKSADKPVDAAGAPSTQATPPAKKTSGTGASGLDPAGSAVPSAPLPSQMDASKSIEELFGGDSTGYALIPPKIRERPPIRLSPEAVQARLSGNVLLVVEVLEDGQVGKILLNRSSGSKILDELARENVARWRFDPARQPQGAKPVRVLTSIWVRFAKGGS